MEPPKLRITPLFILLRFTDIYSSFPNSPPPIAYERLKIEGVFFQRTVAGLEAEAKDAMLLKDINDRILLVASSDPP